MQLTDLQPIEKWIELENQIHARYGLDASVFDPDGIRITGNKKWANQLCPVIKANPKGQTFICSAAHQNIAAQAEKTKKPVIEECDAGMVKIVVPVYLKDQFIGAIGGCGLLLGEDGEIETFLLEKTIGMKESELESLSGSIGTISTIEAEKLCIFISERLSMLTAR